MITGGGLFLFFGTLFWVWAAVDALMTDPHRVRSLQKTLWVLIVLILWAFGAALWIIFGRPRRAVSTVPRTSGFRPSQQRAPRRTVAPDDDPDFLSRLGDELKRNKPDDAD